MKTTNSFFAKKVSLGLLIFFFFISSIAAQTITVSGDNAEKDMTTKIVLNALNGKSVDIYQVLTTTSTFGVGVNFMGGDANPSIGSSTSTNAALLCSTPAELTLDKGAMDFIAGKPGKPTSALFTITANGGTQIFNVRAPRNGLYIGGIATAVGGALFLSGGVILACVEEPSGWGFILGGAAMIGGGIYMTLSARSKITLVEVKF